MARCASAATALQRAALPLERHAGFCASYNRVVRIESLHPIYLQASWRFCSAGSHNSTHCRMVFRNPTAPAAPNPEPQLRLSDPAQTIVAGGRLPSTRR
jgi:hypothetical protein